MAHRQQIHCVVSLSKTLYLLLSTGSTQKGLSWHDWKIVDWHLKNLNQTTNIDPAFIQHPFKQTLYKKVGKRPLQHSKLQPVDRGFSRTSYMHDKNYFKCQESLTFHIMTFQIDLGTNSCRYLFSSIRAHSPKSTHWLWLSTYWDVYAIWTTVMYFVVKVHY